MYLDAVMFVSDDTVVFNSTPTEITQILNDMTPEARPMFYVNRGVNLRSHSVEDYLKLDLA
jgi:hypothetical protein